MDNIIRSKLYRPGSVAYVSRSGGMSNELNNIINIHTNGVFEGVAIGGDRYPGTTFIDHLLRYHVSLFDFLRSPNLVKYISLYTFIEFKIMAPIFLLRLFSTAI